MKLRPGRLIARWTRAGGQRMHTRVSEAPSAGGWPPIWCVHGLSVSSRYMVPTARLLAPWYPIYAPDLPGFGRSARPASALDVPALATALCQRMDAFGVASAVMLGNSMGCQIIAELAARAPARVAAAVLVGPTGDPAARSVVKLALRLLRDLRHESLASWVTQGSDYLRFGPRRTLATLRYALADPFAAKLAVLTAPTLVVRGEHDPIAPHAWCVEVARRLRAGRLVELAGAPHAANYDAPAALASAVLAFLAEPATRAALLAEGAP